MQALRNFRTYFLRGMAALLPTILTIWIFVQCYLFVQNKVSVHINRALVNIIDWATDEYSREVLEQYWMQGTGQITGFIVAIIGVVIIGAFLASWIGRGVWRLVEKAFIRLPIIKQVYHPIRQITDFLLAKKELSFSKVVAIQYPRSGVWSIGLVTGKGISGVSDVQEKDYLTVFVPTSPTPFTGYVIITPREETIELNMTVEEALRFTVSGGVITPSHGKEFESFASSYEY